MNSPDMSGEAPLNRPLERAIGTVLAALAGLAFAGVFYYVLTQLFHVPHHYALPSVIVIGVAEFFCLRIWLLVVGGRKGVAPPAHLRSVQKRKLKARKDNGAGR